MRCSYITHRSLTLISQNAIINQQDEAPKDLDGAVLATSKWPANVAIMTQTKLSLRHSKKANALTIHCGWFKRQETTKENKPVTCENMGSRELCIAPSWTKTRSRCT